MLKICGMCERETQHEFIRTTEVVYVRGESIEVKVEYHKCAECGEEFLDLNSPYDHLAEAYRIYRERKRMLQPEDIRAFRKRYGLTQGELARLLGWGETTLTRYEKGALQSESHNTALRLAMKPSALLRLVEDKPEALNPGKMPNLIKLLKEEVEESHSYSWFIETTLGSYEPDIFSGYKTLNLEKVYNALLYFCREGAYKTKLNKLLFYLDFKYFKEQTVSVTGLRYAHLPFGPVPNDYTTYYSAMLHEGMLRAEEDDNGNEQYYAEVESRLSIFSESEYAMLLEIDEHFQEFSPTEIYCVSHEEVGYKATENSKLISYSFAEELSI